MESNELLNEEMHEEMHEETIKEAFLAKKEMKYAGIFFFVILLLQIPLSFVIYAIREQISPDSYYLVSILFTQGYLFVCAIIYLIIRKKRFTADLQFKKYKISTFFLSLVVLITASPMATVFNLISQFFAKNNTSEAILEISEKLPMWLGVMVVGCLPGFIEETIYRGIMYQAFRKRSVMTGIVVSALSFGLMHMNFNQILYAIYLGVVFALLVEATGSICSTMILHMLFNGMNTMYLYLLPKLLRFLSLFSKEVADMYLDSNGNVNMTELISNNPTTGQLMASLVIYLPLGVAGFVLTILLLKAIAKINGREYTFQSMLGDKRITSVVKPVTVSLVLGWIFCLITAVMALMG